MSEVSRVLHLIRKSTHLNASFILNQITNHINYSPFVGFYEQRSKEFDGGFSNSQNFDFEIISLNSRNGFLEKLRFKVLKQISSKAVSQIKEIIDEKKPKVVHLHYGTDAGLYLRHLKDSEIPTVVSFYGYECSGFPKIAFGLGKWYLKKFVFKYCTFVFAMSEDMKKDLIALGCPEDKVIVHYYGTDVNHFYSERSHVDKKKLDFLIISGFTPQKGHKYLIEAFALAYERNKNITLTIVGAGPLEQEIKNDIGRYELNDVVKTPGAVVYGSKDHLNLFNTHDVFIHPSITDTNGDKEGIPGSLVEAMAAGLPVISTFHAGIPYVLENGKDGLLVEEKDAHALGDAILRIASDLEMRKNLARSAQKRALMELDLKKNEKNLERIYDMASARSN